MTHKPEEAVIVFVGAPEGKGDGIFQANLLTNTVYAITQLPELEYRQWLYTNKQIPWDSFGRAAGNLRGYGVAVNFNHDDYDTSK